MPRIFTSFLFLSLLTVLLWAFPAPAPARIDIDITAAELRKIVVAVPNFVNSSTPGQVEEQGVRMADLLSRALEVHGFIRVIPAKTYGGGQQNDWTSLGAELVVLGQYGREGNDTVLELRVNDAASGRQVLGRRYRNSPEQTRQAVLKFCDETILTLTGEMGISQTSIAFVSEMNGIKEIYLADLLGDQLRRITRHNRLALSPRFTTDGRELSYTSYHRNNPNLYLTELAQDKVTRPISQRAGLNMAPAWHPDGQTMAVTLSPKGNADLFLMDRNGKILEQLTMGEGLNVSPTWSPDGTKLAFVSDRSGKPQIYVLNLKTRQLKRLTYQGTYNTTPAWSPKGDLIAYSGSHERNYQIYLINPDGGTPTQITSGPGNHESPSWSPDGRQIVFSRTLDGHSKICAVFRNGTGQRVLFDGKGEESMPQWSPRTR
ncbi:MAG TPA: Tol-Pal system beta propeller repeat protein TolB [Desulfurivibrionaceae bacterium]|nr:Tol-Pal system beta propeller repeat protein TolB [Desulfurivibrionaceae bacterium]